MVAVGHPDETELREWGHSIGWRRHRHFPTCHVNSETENTHGNKSQAQQRVGNDEFRWESGTGPKLTNRSRDLSVPRRYELARALPVDDAFLEKSILG